MQCLVNLGFVDELWWHVCQLLLLTSASSAPVSVISISYPKRQTKGVLLKTQNPVWPPVKWQYASVQVSFDFQLNDDSLLFLFRGRVLFFVVKLIVSFQDIWCGKWILFWLLILNWVRLKKTKQARSILDLQCDNPYCGRRLQRACLSV